MSSLNIEDCEFYGVNDDQYAFIMDNSYYLILYAKSGWTYISNSII